MRILFMGTPDIAAESLAALLGAGHEVCAVFTRRDKPVGRKQILTAPPVKQFAARLLRVNGDRFHHQNIAGVQSFIELHDGHTGPGIAI